MLKVVPVLGLSVAVACAATQMANAQVTRDETTKTTDDPRPT